MGNLKAAERKISEVFSKWMPDERDGMKKVFRAYHGEPDPTPEPPEFKPGDWVMTNHDGIVKLVSFIEDHPDEWEIEMDGSKALIRESFFRHATNDEMYIMGAIVRYEHGDGKTFLEGEIEGTIASHTGELTRVLFTLLGNARSLDIDRCTLITAAPAGETDDE